MNRMLQTLRSVPEHGSIRLDPEFQADVQWILSYLPQYDGVQMIPDSPTLHGPLVVDSRLTGGGGYFGRHLYFTQYPHCWPRCWPVMLSRFSATILLRFQLCRPGVAAPPFSWHALAKSGGLRRCSNLNYA